MTRSAKNVFDNYPTLYAIHETSDHTCLILIKNVRNLQLFTRRPELAFNPFFDSTSAGI